MTGSHQKCSENVDSKQVVDSRLACEGEAKENNARYFSYEDANKLCSHSTTCSPIRTVWAWNIFIRITGTRLCLHFTYIYIYIYYNCMYHMKTSFDNFNNQIHFFGLDELKCVEGDRVRERGKYGYGIWNSNAISSGKNDSNRDECWRLVQANVENAVGIYWDHKAGWCRAINDPKPLLPWPNSFPDYKSSVILCILKNITQG